MNDMVIIPPDELQLKQRLAVKIAKVMAAVSHVEKKGTNSAQNYKFAAEGDVLAQLRPAMIEHGLVWIPGITSTGVSHQVQGKNGMREILKADLTIDLIDTETGYSFTTHWTGLGEGGDDKAVNKAATSALKYFLLKLFMVPTGDDPDAGSYQEPKRAPAPRPANPPSEASAWLESIGMDQPARSALLRDLTAHWKLDAPDHKRYQEAIAYAKKQGCSRPEAVRALLMDGETN